MGFSPAIENWIKFTKLLSGKEIFAELICEELHRNEKLIFWKIFLEFQCQEPVYENNIIHFWLQCTVKCILALTPNCSVTLLLSHPYLEVR